MDHKAIIQSVLTQFADQIVASPAEIDNVGRRLLPHFIAAMPANERDEWGVLEKRTSNPYSVPYDILVKRSTREHFDVLTSAPVSGDKEDKTGPRRLIGRFESAGILPKPTWHWCDWRATQTPIVPLGTLVEVPESDPEEPPAPRPVDLEARVAALEQWARSFPK